MRRTAHAVRSIRLAGEAIAFSRGSLEVEEDAPRDFVLEFDTPGGHNLSNGAIEVEVADGRVYRGSGLDANPNPWSHRYVNGLGTPGWADGDPLP